MKCPVCERNELHPDEVMNSLSRKDNTTYICDECGVKEALDELQEYNNTPNTQ